MQKLPLLMSRTEWMKGIYFLWSRGRHSSPLLPGNRYLKLGSQKRSPGRNLGEQRLVRRSGTTSRGTALLVLRLHMHGSPLTEFFTIRAAKWQNTRVKHQVPQYVDKNYRVLRSCLSHLLLSRSYNLGLLSNSLKSSYNDEQKELNEKMTLQSISRHLENLIHLRVSSETCVVFASYGFPLCSNSVTIASITLQM